MTTDPVTEARDDAARFLWALPDDHPAKPLHNDGFMQTHARVVASLMAEWARTHLTAQEPNPVPDESEMEVVGDWLVVRNAQEPDYPAGPEYGPYPYSDAAPLIQLSRVAGYPPEPQEPTDAEVEAAARALHIAQLDGDPFAGDAWDEQPHHAPRKAWLRDLAHAALRGARTARRDEENR